MLLWSTKSNQPESPKSRSWNIFWTTNSVSSKQWLTIEGRRLMYKKNFWLTSFTSTGCLNLGWHAGISEIELIKTDQNSWHNFLLELEIVGATVQWSRKKIQYLISFILKNWVWNWSVWFQLVLSFFELRNGAYKTVIHTWYTFCGFVHLKFTFISFWNQIGVMRLLVFGRFQPVL